MAMPYYNPRAYTLSTNLEPIPSERLTALRSRRRRQDRRNNAIALAFSTAGAALITGVWLGMSSSPPEEVSPTRDDATEELAPLFDVEPIYSVSRQFLGENNDHA